MESKLLVLFSPACCSVVLNVLLLLTLRRRQRGCHPVELLIVNMAVCDLLQSCLCLPAFTVSAFSHKWPFGMYCECNINS